MPLPQLKVSTTSELRILRSDASGVLLEFTSGDVRRDPLGGGSMEVLNIEGCGLTHEVGKPQVPLRAVFLGIPQGSSVRAQILEAELQELGEVDLAPAPRGDDWGTTSWIKDTEVYATNALYPSAVAQLDRPITVRSQQIASLRLYPLQYNPVLRKAYCCHKMRVLVTFTPGRGASQGVYPDGFDDVFRNLLVNYEQAKAWRKPLNPPKTTSFVFDSGPWYKVKVLEDGLYKVTGSDLQKAGVDISQVDPRTLKLYSGGGRILPRDTNAVTPDTMRQLAVWVVGEEDGKLDPGDYIVFYGKGLYGPYYASSLDTFMYFNPYTDTNAYWLTWGNGPGRRMVSKDGSLSSPNPIRPQSFMSRAHVEQDNVNIYGVGLKWYWENLGTDTIQTAYYKTNLVSVETQQPCSLLVNFAATGNCKNLPDCNVPWDRDVAIWFNSNYIWNGHLSGRFPMTPETKIQAFGPWALEGENTVQIQRHGDPIAFDWYEVVYRRRFEAQEGRLDFSVAGNPERGRYEFSINNFSDPAIEVFDITDPFAPARITHPAPGGGTLRFQDDVDTLRSYTASVLSAYKAPAGIVPKPYSNLHDPNNTADYIVITNDQFYDQMQAIRALRSKNHTVLLVRLSNVYDEFSWGLPDPAAVRNFLRYAYEYWNQGQRTASYAMFVGDGNSDFKNHLHLAHPKSLFPIYVSGNYYDLMALGIEDTMTDDWFVYLHQDTFPEMKIGRLPVQTLEDASIVIDKILHYDSPETFGAWRNRAVFVADDEYKGCADDDYDLTHVNMTEEIATQHFTRQFDFTKVYLTEYARDAYCKKPGAEADVIKAISDGAVFVSFVGHGGWWVWAHEQAFLAPADVTLLSNGKKLPIIASASCAVGKFHMIDNECMAELEVRARDKGAIATIAAVGGTYGRGPNEYLVMNFLDKAFRDSTDLGSGLEYAKFLAKYPANNQSILLLGDPGLQPAQPHFPVSLSLSDTIGYEGKRLARVTGSVGGGFNGTALVTAFDSDTLKHYISPRPGYQTWYRLPGIPVFRGLAKVTNGQFSANFFVPTGLRAGKGGRASAYIWNDQEDGHGALDSIPVRGYDDSTARDDGKGPSIAFYVNGKPLQDGDRVAPNFTLVGQLEDESGINLSKQQPERYRLRMVVNQDRLNAKYLSDYFTYDLGSYMKGSFSTPVTLYAPNEGDSTYTLTVEAADNFLNRSSDSVKVVVGSELDLKVKNLVNYPNPFKDDTQFTFELTQSADAEIKIYTVAGRLIRSLRPGILPAGYNQVYWDGKDADGDRLANGVYLYKISAKAVKSGSEVSAKEFGRLVVMR